MHRRRAPYKSGTSESHYCSDFLCSTIFCLGLLVLLVLSFIARSVVRPFAILSVRPSFCLSVGLSVTLVIHACTVQCVEIMSCTTRQSGVSSFSTEFRRLHFIGSPQTRELNRGKRVKGDNSNKYAAITWKRCEIRYNLLTNRKSHTGFESVPKSVTLSDLDSPNGRHYALFHTLLGPTASNSPALSATM